MVQDFSRAHPEESEMEYQNQTGESRECHAFVSVLDENPKQCLPMNMHRACVLAIISSAQQMAAMF